MKLLFTICGRAGSKGIQNKNAKNFLDKPLALYSLSVIDLYLKKTNYSADIVINTDSDELINIFNENCLRPVEIIERTPDLAGDKVAKIDVIYDCLEKMEKIHGIYDLIIDLDITSPLRTVNDLDMMIENKLNTDYDLIFSVTDSRRNPYFNMVMKTDNGYDRVIKSNFNTRQEAPVIYDMNASIYVYSREFLQKRTGLFDGKCGIHKMFDTGILDLDHENDMLLMEVIAKYLFDNNEEFYEVYSNI
ncbi:MAG: acylneuraminate cytidylyltransferase family protein [Methanobrevibacter millerae]|uniref:Acylneuraminate cytidylyltransferase family protein n=1 Tax=Methanobrevibacter millerae TaxID=230361 RepID=A0A8T3VKS3_9EURY|nr:acylneuraminate cytidylyltransferase family protein [Methanobrevibacter millerae]MBE6505280.1 acylneuraminate cytidylyltransferase family protein [Methanobrevibacter millerae]